MLVVTSGVLFFSVLVWFNYSAVLPAIIDAWGLSGLRAGLVFSAFQVGYLLAILPAGRLADRYPARWVVAAGAVGTGLASLLFGVFARGFGAGVALRLVAGCCMAGVYVPGMRFLSDWYPADVRGRALGVYVGAYSFASGLSFVVGTSVMAAVGWRAAILVTSAGAVLVGPVMLLATTDPDGGTDRAARSFDLTVLTNRAYLAAVAVYTLHSWEVFGVRNWLLVFIVTTPAVVAGTAPVAAGTVVGVAFMLGGLGNLLGGWASDTLGRTRTIALALATSGGISLVVPLLVDIPYTALVAVILVYGVALTADSSPVSTAITEVVADEHVGVALSIQSLVGYTGAAVAPVLFGVALDGVGFRIAFWTLAAAALAGLGSLAALQYHRPRGATVGG
jgi:MFS family permease